MEITCQILANKDIYLKNHKIEKASEKLKKKFQNLQNKLLQTTDKNKISELDNF